MVRINVWEYKATGPVKLSRVAVNLDPIVNGELLAHYAKDPRIMLAASGSELDVKLRGLMDRYIELWKVQDRIEHEVLMASTDYFIEHHASDNSEVA